MWVISANQVFHNDGSFENIYRITMLSVNRFLSTWIYNRLIIVGLCLDSWMYTTTNWYIVFLILYDIYEKALTTVYYMLPDGLRLQILFVNLCPMFLIFSRLSCSNNVMIKAYIVGWPERGRILHSMIYWACCYSFL